MQKYQNPTTGEIVQEEERNPQDLANQGFLPITSEALQPQSQIQLSDKPIDNTNYQGLIAGGQSLLDNFSNTVSASSTDLNDLFKNYLSNEPPKQADIYNAEYTNAGIEPLQQDVLAKQTSVKQAQNEMNLINAQIQALNKEAEAVPLQIQEEFKGRGVTAGGIAPIQAGRLREIALRSLPLQTQAYMAQAKVLAAQGDLGTSQQALNIAQNKLDTVFKLKSQDAQNAYNYRQNLIDKVYDFATKQQQRQLDALKEKNNIALDLYKTNSSIAQNISKTAMENGQADIASQITQLVAHLYPNSATFQQDLATFQQDLAALQAQIIPKQKELTPTEKYGTGIIGEYQYYAEQEKLAGRKPISFNEYQNMDANRKVKISGGGGGGTTKLDAGNEWDYAQQILDANPNATTEELKVGLLKNTKLNATEINALLDTRIINKPETFSEEWFKEKIKQAKNNDFSNAEIIDYLLKNFDINELFKSAKAAGYARWYSGKESDIKRYIESLL